MLQFCSNFPIKNQDWEGLFCGNHVGLNQCMCSVLGYLVGCWDASDRGQSHLSMWQRQSHQDSSDTFPPCFQTPSSLKMKSLAHLVKFCLEAMATFILCHVKGLLWFGSDSDVSSVLLYTFTSCLCPSSVLSPVGFWLHERLTFLWRVRFYIFCIPFASPRHEHLWWDISWRELQTEALWHWLGQHGQCWTRHQWFPVLHHPDQAHLVGWQTRCIWKSPGWDGNLKYLFFSLLQSFIVIINKSVIYLIFICVLRYPLYDGFWRWTNYMWHIILIAKGIKADMEDVRYLRN